MVTPESSLPVLPDQIPQDVWLRYEHPFNAPGRAALVGIFTGDDQRGYTNTLVGLDATHHMSDGSYYHYGKRHLLPFGEFIPPGFKWMIDLMKVPVGDQARGVDTAPFVVAGQRVRPLICYEDLFGEDFAESMVGPGAATLLVNSTNLAWFGKRMIQDQHLQFSRMRALEFQRGQVRSTNTGATAVIDYRGDVTARMPPLVEGQLDATVEGRTGRRRPTRSGSPQWQAVALVGTGVRADPGRRDAEPELSPRNFLASWGLRPSSLEPAFDRTPIDGRLLARVTVRARVARAGGAALSAALLAACASWMPAKTHPRRLAGRRRARRRARRRPRTRCPTATCGSSTTTCRPASRRS